VAKIISLVSQRTTDIAINELNKEYSFIHVAKMKYISSLSEAFVSIYLLLNSSIVAINASLATDDTTSSISDLLALGDAALIKDDTVTAIEHYEKGVTLLTTSQPPEQLLKNDESLLPVIISLYTNYGTALSQNPATVDAAIDTYKKAIITHRDAISNVGNTSTKKEADDNTAQAAFFLGLTFEDINNWNFAVESYVYAHELDPGHWASLGNMGAILHDRLKRPAEALTAYRDAFELLTASDDRKVTDRPSEPRYVLSQLQYRIGMALVSNESQKCAMDGDVTKTVSCAEHAAHAFSLALEYDDGNDVARHMLAGVTADATVERASQKYVTELFDSYAENFEHSLVAELKYTGYETLRLGFDEAFGGRDNVPTFPLVVDAGCGTGLAGEQFRNISETLIGVDLSPSIIDEAKKARPGLYDKIIVSDVTEIFSGNEYKNKISLIIAADSYLYFGDIEPLFRSMEEGVTSDGGYIAFTLENVSHDDEASLAATKPDWRWQITASGRFAHRKEYVVSVGKRHSFELVHYDNMDGFRYEGSVPVRGHLFIMKKMAEGGEGATVASLKEEL